MAKESHFLPQLLRRFTPLPFAELIKMRLA
jgi:hypothetical protein